MDFRFRLLELLIIANCFLATGALLAFSIAGTLSDSGYLYSVIALFPALTLIVRNRIRKVPPQFAEKT